MPQALRVKKGNKEGSGNQIHTLMSRDSTKWRSQSKSEKDYGGKR
jgi:hypothetical protein